MKKRITITVEESVLNSLRTEIEYQSRFTENFADNQSDFIEKSLLQKLTEIGELRESNGLPLDTYAHLPNAQKDSNFLGIKK